MSKAPRKASTRVSFSAKSAKRIARVVRLVEGGDRKQGPTTLRTSVGDDAIIRGTFTAPWNKGATATVTDANLSAVTYEAKNYFAAVSGTGSKACAIAYAGGEWILIAVEC
jgi:hypothetical protein